MSRCRARIGRVLPWCAWASAGMLLRQIYPRRRETACPNDSQIFPESAAMSRVDPALKAARAGLAGSSRGSWLPTRASSRRFETVAVVLALFFLGCSGEKVTAPCLTCDGGTEPRPALGVACTADSECPQGALCLTPDSTDLFGGAGPHGVCVADCSSDASACSAFANAVCVDVSPSGAAGPDAGAAPHIARCFEACSLGDQTTPKCHGLDGVACDPLASPSGAQAFCRPLCTTDAECGARTCDNRSGVCIQGPSSPDDSLGLACGQDAGSCSGLCVDFGSGAGACSHQCIFGITNDCQQLSGDPGGCIFTVPGGGIGDVGYCAELCDCPSDCKNASDVCDPFNNANLEAAFGHRGVCTAPSLAINAPAVCP